MTGSVLALRIHPVTGEAAVELDSVGVGVHGLDGDRRKGAPVHLVSEQALARSDDPPPRANLLIDLTEGDERDWIGQDIEVGSVVLHMPGHREHCLGVYAEVVTPGRINLGDVVSRARLGSSAYIRSAPAPAPSASRGVSVSAQITVTVAGSERSVTGGHDGRRPVPRRASAAPHAVVVARVGGRAARPRHELPTVTRSSRSPWTRPTGSCVLRHSAAHVLAQAVQQVNPQARLGIGPPDPRRVLLRLRRGRAVHPRGPEGPREGHAADRQRVAELPAPGRVRRRGAGRARRPSRTSWS